MRLREDEAGKAQARGRYRRGIGGRSNPSPSGSTYLHGKSRMKSQLRRLAWGGEGGELEECCPQGGMVSSTGVFKCFQVRARAVYGEDREEMTRG